MREQVLRNAMELAARAAKIVASEARLAVRERNLFTVAFSGGSTPWRMLRLLANEDVPWERTHIFQVDERFAPASHSQRNQTGLTEALLNCLPTAPTGVHWMPVDDGDPDLAAASYAEELRSILGTNGSLDLVHLGLGDDGHTASLVPDDPALEESGRDVAVTGPYRGFRRMTLTAPFLSRARTILWIVSGPEKGPALARLRRGDPGIPASRIDRGRALLLVDAAAHDASRDQRPPV